VQDKSSVLLHCFFPPDYLNAPLNVSPAPNIFLVWFPYNKEMTPINNIIPANEYASVLLAVPPRTSPPMCVGTTDAGLVGVEAPKVDLLVELGEMATLVGTEEDPGWRSLALRALI